MTDPTGPQVPSRPPSRRCAVLGSPIAHSLSPALHGAAYAHLGLDWAYARCEVDQAGLSGFLDDLRGGWRGLSLTMPLKQVALACCDSVSDLARHVAAVNTVILADGGSRAGYDRAGHNTDVPGMVNALAERDVTRVPEAVVLGGGATARSALAALARVTDGVVVYVRTSARADDLHATAAAVGVRCDVRPWGRRAEALDAGLVVATTPKGGVDDLAAVVPARVGALVDVVYDPWPTPLAATWAAAGGTVVSGLDVLVHQAALQVVLMTGREVPVHVLRAAGESALAARTRGGAA